MEEVRLVVVMDVVVVLDIMVLRVVMVVMVLVLGLVMMLVLWLVMVSSPKEEGRWPAVAIACCIAAACNKKIFNFFQPSTNYRIIPSAYLDYTFISLVLLSAFQFYYQLYGECV